MTSPYDFGYGWSLLWFHAFPLVIGALLAGAGLWLHWRSWIVVLGGVIALWGCAGLSVVHVLGGGINAPIRLPSAQFLAADRGKFLDVGAGSGRASIGVLQARPHATATAIDLYSGFYGIEGNTPARFMTNARIGGVADRVDGVEVGDMRTLPFAADTFEGVISTYAVDHIPRRDQPVAIAEIHRVLKARGELLLEIVNQDFWVRLSMPIPHFGLAAHRAQDPGRWRAMLEQAGFEVVEEGTRPVTLYWMARKR
jgi:SAM-dependent methyltransferase